MENNKNVIIALGYDAICCIGKQEEWKNYAKVIACTTKDDWYSLPNDNFPISILLGEDSEELSFARIATWIEDVEKEISKHIIGAEKVVIVACLGDDKIGTGGAKTVARIAQLCKVPLVVSVVSIPCLDEDNIRLNHLVQLALSELNMYTDMLYCINQNTAIKGGSETYEGISETIDSEIRAMTAYILERQIDYSEF